MSSYFRDPSFQDLLLAFVVKDRNFLKKCAEMLTPADFRPKRSQAMERWVISQLALEYWNKYRQPIKRMLRAEILSYAKQSNLSTRREQELLKYGERIKKLKCVAAEAMEDKVVEFKKEKLKTDAVQELIDAQSNGTLSDEKWLEICQSAVDRFGPRQFTVTDYLDEKELDLRISRRSKRTVSRFPLLFIDPIDQNIRTVGRGHIGLLLGPYKSMKSLGLIYLATVYPLQAMNVLYITLEDPKEDVEDRFDACVTALPIARLSELPLRLKKRFLQTKALLRARIQIVDGTEGGFTTGKIEEVFKDQRNKGFTADVIIVDYDDEIVPMRKRDKRKEEFEDIYRGLRQLASKLNVILWTAAQTQRGTEDLKIISGDKTADDISKMRKVTFCLGLGKGDWGDDSKYLYVAAHKLDRGHIGWNICTDKSRMLFYDREATMKMLRHEAEYGPKTDLAKKK